MPSFFGGGDAMRRLFLETLLLCSLISANAFANTIIHYFPNDGSGDNFGFVTYGVGFYIAGGGGTPVAFFNDFVGYAPGSTLGGSTDIFFSSGFARIGPISSDVAFFVGTLFLSSITLPTNGQDFRAPVEIDFGASGILLSTGDTIDAGGGAQGFIKFDFINGAYYPESFVQAPEPGTLALIGTGLLGIFARTRKKILGEAPWSPRR
jgi:hypothetical protein